MKITRDLRYGEVDGRALLLDVYDPGLPSGSRRPAMLVLHGGGWEGGDKASEDCARDAAHFASLGMLALSVGYRLSGEAPAPAAVEDVKCATRWLRAHADEWRVDPHRIAASGGSAGGHLALLLALSPRGAFEGEGGWADAPSGTDLALSYLGVTDVEDLLEVHQRDFARKWLPFPEPGRSDLARRLSPVHLARRDAAPVFVAHGDADDLVPYEQALRLTSALRAAGADFTFHPIPGGGHGTWPEPRAASEGAYRAAQLAFLRAHGFLAAPEAARA